MSLDCIREPLAWHQTNTPNFSTLHRELSLSLQGFFGLSEQFGAVVRAAKLQIAASPRGVPGTLSVTESFVLSPFREWQNASVSKHPGLRLVSKISFESGWVRETGRTSIRPNHRTAMV